MHPYETALPYPFHRLQRLCVRRKHWLSFTTQLLIEVILILSERAIDEECAESTFDYPALLLPVHTGSELREPNKQEMNPKAMHLKHSLNKRMKQQLNHKKDRIV